MSQPATQRSLHSPPAWPSALPVGSRFSGSGPQVVVNGRAMPGYQLQAFANREHRLTVRHRILPRPMLYPGVQAQPMVVDCSAVVDERTLVERLAAGEPAAVGEMYDAHHRAVHAFAWRLVGDPELAEDLVHDVFVALPKAARRFRGDSSLRTFLISIAINHARHHIRAASRRRAAMERLGREPDEVGRTPEGDARQAELARALTLAMDELSVDHRITFVLAEVEDRSSKEVAEILGIPDATVRTRLHHAKKRLRESLERGGFR